MQVEYIQMLVPFQKAIHKFQSKALNVISIVTIILYLGIFLGLWASAPQYLSDLQYYIKIYVGLFLIYRFNPFRNIKFTDLDRRIAFTAGMLLVASYILQYVFDITNIA